MKKQSLYICKGGSSNGGFKTGDKVLINTAYRKPVNKLTRTDRFFNRLNSPLLTLIVLAGFLALCWYAWPRPIVVTVPHAQQEGYEPAKVKAMAKFVKFKLAEYKKVSDATTIISIFDSKE
jgi:hypothetical protein